MAGSHDPAPCLVSWRTTHLGNHKQTIVASLSQLVLTIDRRPYVSLELSGGCDPESCVVALVGKPAATTGYGDRWSVRGSAATGWIGVLDPGDPPVVMGVPRRLVREAERIARADPPTAAVIRGFDSIGSASWDPASPGVIALYYQSACGCCGSNGDINAQVAEADPGPGACVGGLLVSVDVGAGRVLGMNPG